MSSMGRQLIGRWLSDLVSVPWRQATSIAGIKLASTESNHYFFPRIVPTLSRAIGFAKLFRN
jgi:hypothetical protein